MKTNRILTFLIVLLTSYSCNNNSYESQKDIIKVQKGMKIQEVISIMRNRPFKIEASDDNISFYEFYKAPIGASGYYYIEYRKKDSLVMNTYCGD